MIRSVKSRFTRCQRRFILCAIIILISIYFIHKNRILLDLPNIEFNDSPSIGRRGAGKPKARSTNQRYLEQDENPKKDDEHFSQDRFDGSEPGEKDPADFDDMVPVKDEKEMHHNDLFPEPVLGIAGTWGDATAEFSQKQQAVVDEFSYAWSAYKKSAWGRDHLKPLSGSYDTWFEMGLTILDSLDNLILFRLKSEYAEARTWVETKLSFEQDKDYVNLFECTIRVLGGLLSAHTLTGDPLYSDKAKDIADRLLPAWSQSKTAIPLSDINPYRKRARPPKWGSDSSTSEVTTVQLEFREVAAISNDFNYAQPAIKTSREVSRLVNAQHDNKFIQMFISPHSGKMSSRGTITFGARTDSYYEYLLKQWVQTNGDQRNEWLLDDYLNAMIDLRDQLITVTHGEHQLTFVAELKAGRMSPKMDHLVCFLPGTLALGHWFSRRIHLGGTMVPDWHLELAEELARTCHFMYKTSSGLAPEIVYFNVGDGAKEEMYIKPADAFSILRPESVESWFYLWRITKNQKYRDWGWDFFESLKKNARLENGRGYASVNDVKQSTTTKRDKMESFFLAETLKYLFLLFSDDETLLPLDQYVFNTEAHIMLIRNSQNDKMFD